MIKNYHKESEKYEKAYENELVYYFGILITELNQISNLTEKNIDTTIKLWQIEYLPEIKELNKNHIKKLNRFTNRILPTDQTPSVQKDKITELTSANDKMLGITTDYIKQKFTELSILENNFDYSTDLSSKFIQSVVNTTADKLELFATMSTIGAIRQLLTEYAEEAGWTQYLWQTQEDNRVRPAHVAMNQRWFNLDDPNPQPAGCHPGEDYNCRCWILNFRKPGINGEWIYKY